MPVDIRTQDAPQPRLLVTMLNAHNTCVVHVTGELDLATSEQLVAASTAGHHAEMVIDLSGVTFMDCSGYGALIASRLAIEAEGRSLTTTGQTGQPARLFDLITRLETCPLRPGLNHRSGPSHHLTC